MEQMELEVNIADVEKKVSKILKLIKNKDQSENDVFPRDLRKESELVRLVEDFHKQYQSLVALCDNLKGELEKKGRGRKGKERLSSSTSSSDSEYYSSEDTEKRNRLKSERLKAANIMKEELEAENTEVSELKHQLASNTEEKEALVSDYMTALSKIEDAETINKNLRNEVDEREKELAALVKMHEVLENQASSLKSEGKEGLLVRVMDLELEVETLLKRKNDVEEQMSSKISETSQLREERGGMPARILELEGLFPENGSEASVGKNYQAGDEASAQIVAFKAQVDHLLEELDALKIRNSQLELHLEGERQDYLQSLSQMEDQNKTLTGKIADQQRILKEQEKTINKFIEDSKLVKRWSWSSAGTSNSKLNQHALERKMQDLAEEFRKKLEDNIRLLYQRIRVAEKIHYENKENFRKIKEKFEQKTVALKERVAIYEVESKKSTGRVEPRITALAGLDSAVRKLEDIENFLTRISNVTKELVFAKNWASERNKEIRQLRNKMNTVVKQLDDKEEHEFLLSEKVWNLEASLSKEVGEKLNLSEVVSQLEKKIKEKDDRLLGLGEEKREAIRQLCLLIDYYRSCYNGVKEIISNSNVVNRERT
ncbi:hypothetical protein SLEP1_g34885 [Rubroshorea leprosula]|uniref:NAB domain-containing protein n=1 Tax=Rubroshorea leprosula TaxID=152421 RepID=A0AAV5KLG1_9ROSI|nr:hypothetical protein SLEP1_g34885 [Rubroshorea leprosula]